MEQKKARLEIRFDPELYEKLRDLADKTKVSINSLLERTAGWLVEYAHVGEPHFDQNTGYLYETKPSPGVIWIGEDKLMLEDEDGDQMDIGPVCRLILDFRPKATFPPPQIHRKNAKGEK